MMPDYDDAYTIIDYIDQVNGDPDFGNEVDDDTATEWDEMSDYDLEDKEEDDDDGEEYWF